MILYYSYYNSKQQVAVERLLEDLGFSCPVENNVRMLMEMSKGKANPVHGFVFVPPESLPFDRPITSAWDFFEWVKLHGLVPT